jgi:hypothetical protein
MPENHRKSFNPLQRAWQWIKNRLIQTVPDENAVCEFDCRKGNCTVAEWKTCERRTQKAATGDPGLRMA